MTSAIRRVAGGMLIFESAWTAYGQLFAFTPPNCSLNLCTESQSIQMYSPVLLGLAAVLLVDGLMGIWGSWFAYPTGAVFSAILLVIMGFSAWIESGSAPAYIYSVGDYYDALIGAFLGAIALLVNLFAWRAKNVLSEQANPMNLPVFG